jgi:hypothetical protein
MTTTARKSVLASLVLPLRGQLRGKLEALVTLPGTGDRECAHCAAACPTMNGRAHLDSGSSAGLIGTRDSTRTRVNLPRHSDLAEVGAELGFAEW